MGNKLLASPFPTYESALSQLSSMEISHIKTIFYVLSQKSEIITYENFMQITSKTNPAYVRKHILPRLFAVFDTKKDNQIDFEEYVCAIALFRLGSTDDKIKLLYFIYDGSKYGGNLVKDNFKQLLVDATICVQKTDISIGSLENWIADLHLLSDAMVETALFQFSSHPGKLDIQEFVAFVKMEGSIQGLLAMIPTLIDY